jgi:hypothetical protein
MRVGTIFLSGVILFFVLNYALAGSYITLDKPGASQTYAHGINGNNIVGWYQDAPGNYHGFLYDGTDWTTLDMPGSTNTKLLDLDGSNIVGIYETASSKGIFYITVQAGLP